MLIDRDKRATDGNALLISIRMYSEVFASVSAAGATGLCSSSFALTGCVAAYYRHGKRSAQVVFLYENIGR